MNMRTPELKERILQSQKESWKSWFDCEYLDYDLKLEIHQYY